MRPFKYIIIAISMLMCYRVSAREVYTVEQVPNPKTTDLRRSVSDPEGILSSAAVSHLDQTIYALQADTGHEIAVVVLPSIGNIPPEDFAVRLFKRFGIGKSDRDEGLLILLVTADRVVRFEVGYGLEGVLTDAVSHYIQNDKMLPYLRGNDWGGTLTAGVDAVDQYLCDPENGLAAIPDNMQPGAGDLFAPLATVFIAMIFILWYVWATSRRARRCPRCRHIMKKQSEDRVKVSPSTYVLNTTWVCPNCGYRTTTQSRDNNIGGTIGGGMIGGMMGGMLGRGGGGGFGGDFGGGRSGGGGATTRF